MQLRRRKVTCDPKSARLKPEEGASPPAPLKRGGGPTAPQLSLGKPGCARAAGAAPKPHAQASAVPAGKGDHRREAPDQRGIHYQSSWCASRRSISTHSVSLQQPDSALHQIRPDAGLPQLSDSATCKEEPLAAKGPIASHQEGWGRAGAACEGPAVLPQSDVPGAIGKARWRSPSLAAWPPTPHNKGISSQEGAAPGSAACSRSRPTNRQG